MSDHTASTSITRGCEDTGQSRWGLREGQAAVTAWRASGLSQRAWCRQSGVSDKRLSYWKSQVDQDPLPAAEPEAAPSGFVAVVAAEQKPRWLRVSVGAVTVEVAPDFDARHLRAVVEALS